MITYKEKLKKIIIKEKFNIQVIKLQLKIKKYNLKFYN